MKVKIFLFPHFDRTFSLPTYQTPGAVGADIRAQIPDLQKLVISPGLRVMIPTGLAFEIPSGYEMQVRPRSGLSFKRNLLIVNSPGTIDSDYRGELKILMGNFGNKDEIINHGDRLAQLVLAPIIRATFVVSSELEQTMRGESGFGSTGI